MIYSLFKASFNSESSGDCACTSDQSVIGQIVHEIIMEKFKDFKTRMKINMWSFKNISLVKQINLIKELVLNSIMLSPA